MEVRVTPTPDEWLPPPPPVVVDDDVGVSPPPPPPPSEDPYSYSVAVSDVQKLEALFGKSAYFKEPQMSSSSSSSSSMTTTDVEDEDNVEEEHDENYLWDHVVGKTIHEIVVPKSISVPPPPPPPTPLQLAQEWMIRHHHPTMSTTNDDHSIPLPVASFTMTNTSHVDEAYEYVWTNIAMLMDDSTSASTSTSTDHADSTTTPNTSTSSIYYLVLPHFLPRAATSFEKFTREIQQLYGLLLRPPPLEDAATTTTSIKSPPPPPTTTTTTTTPHLTLVTYHPEHIQASHRSPVPILAMVRTTHGP